MRAIQTPPSTPSRPRGVPAETRSPVVPLPDQPITYPPAEEPVPERDPRQPPEPERPERPQVVPTRPQPARPVPAAPPAGAG